MLWLLVVISLVALGSCGKDERTEPQETSVLTSGNSITLKLSAEIGFEEDEGDLKGLTFKLEEVNGKKIPRPQFENGQQVPVHTIIKSNTGAYGIQTLMWRYDESNKKLVLKQDDGNNISVSNFNYDTPNTKWYVSGLLAPGTVLNGTKVEMMGTRVLKGVSGNAGDVVGDLNVPYAFGWTELKIATDKAKEASPSTSYKYALMPEGANVEFKPLGSLIAYKLGNKQQGFHTFTPASFIVRSDLWGDQGTFDLNTDPTSNPTPEELLPKWEESACGSQMYYTFASEGDKPGTLASYTISSKTYYAWVMPNSRTASGIEEVQVILRGTSSRYASNPAKDYTKMYLTDFHKGGAQSKVKPGKIHILTARAILRVSLPIEYVTERNLAGGEGLTYTASNLTSQPAALSGPLRFADSDRNDASGYYNWYKLTGASHYIFNNRSTLSLTSMYMAPLKDMDGATVTLRDKYNIPRIDQWWGIFPNTSLRWTGTNEKLNQEEYMGALSFNSAYKSDYSRGYSTDDATDDAVIYAIRFKSRVDNCTPITNTLHYSSGNIVFRYLSAMDNSMKCAYRYTRKGGSATWSDSQNVNMDNRLIIDVVYLGDETTETTLSTISSPSWWSARQAEGKIISRTFPAAGDIEGQTVSTGALHFRGSWGAYWSLNQNPSDGKGLGVGMYSDYVSGDYSWDKKVGLPVRLFKRDPDVQ